MPNTAKTVRARISSLGDSSFVIVTFHAEVAWMLTTKIQRLIVAAMRHSTQTGNLLSPLKRTWRIWSRIKRMASSGNPIPSNKPTGQQIHKINTGLVIGARLIHMEIWIEWAVVHSVNQCRQTKRIKFSQLKTYRLQSKTKMISSKRRIPWIWRIRINRKLRASRKTSTFSNQKKFKTTFNRVPKVGSKC